ncbi:MAG: dipicolinate synthase subunit B [Oscillospiraceae bacterium]|nr:dipicolinate synthase subunit B [Oscillospiraceae bacterium]MCI8878248.1 dipicolinate synthase subunit B [Oscillospiraceae bacterium]
MRTERVGFALCGSFCTHAKVLRELEGICGEYEVVVPVVSEICQVTDTRFGTAKSFMKRVEELTGRRAIRSVVEAEPIGPKKLLDVLVIAPCTGNTLGKLAAGITDTAVTMAAKAHLRNDCPVVVAVASNDGLSGAARNLGELLVRKNYFFVPFGQDDPENKPCSLVADFSRIGETVEAALEGRQVQPLLLR